jgi:hypothetical protein
MLFTVAANSEIEGIYAGKNSMVILTDKEIYSEDKLNSIGRDVCSEKAFCVLWFYSDKNLANIGASAMKSGDMFSQTKGPYSIFSKNKKNNNVICYNPIEGC